MNDMHIFVQAELLKLRIIRSLWNLIGISETLRQRTGVTNCSNFEVNALKPDKVAGIFKHIYISLKQNLLRWLRFQLFIPKGPIDCDSTLFQIVACHQIGYKPMHQPMMIHFIDANCFIPLHWRHNGRDGVSNHQPCHCLLNSLFRRRSKKTSKLRVTGLCAGNSPVTGEFPAQMSSNAENVSIWWCHHVSIIT